MKVTEMTRKQMDAVPLRKDWKETVTCRALVILPLRVKHDSGYRCMDFLAVSNDDEPICRLSGCSDVLHIDGIGGFGDWNPSFGVPSSVPPKGWSMDCLPKSGLLRLFGPGLKCTEALSSFCVYGQRDRG